MPPPLEDPTQPLRATGSGKSGAAPPQRPSLSSVLIGQDRRFAVIDGRRMTEGESRAGIKVWEIRADRVVVSVNGSPRMVLEIGNSRMHKELR
ncbi:MAG: general secretion pathway protein GspB [Pseudomonadales bacterium]